MGVLPASLWVAATWSILAAGFGSLFAFTLAAAVLLATRPTRGRTLPSGSILACGLAGACSYPIWAHFVATCGSALGWAPRGSVAAPGALEIAALVLVGPAFEELLYRERLLPALERHAGAGAAVLGSSVVFALPHLDPWSSLAAVSVGPALGTLYLATRNVWACTAAHAGLNVAALWATRS